MQDGMRNTIGLTERTTRTPRSQRGRFGLPKLLNLSGLLGVVGLVLITGLPGAATAGSATGPARSEQPAPLTAQGQIVLHTATASPLCLALDAYGVLYVAEQATGTIRCITRDGESAVLVSGIAEPCAVTADHRRQLLVGTRTGDIWRILPNGRARLIGSVGEPISSLTADRDGAAIAATLTGTVIRFPDTER